MSTDKGFSEQNVNGDFSVDDAINRAGFGKFQKRLLVIAGFGWVADACELFILALIGDFLACDWTLYRWQVAMMSSIALAGFAIGSLIFGTIADIYGRKTSFAVSTVILFLSGLSSAAAPSFLAIVILRGIVGFAISGDPQVLTLCMEFCPTRMRARVGFYLTYFWALGSCSTILLTWVCILYFNSWRILLALLAIPALIVLTTLKWYPESARYYLVSNKKEKAMAVLQDLAAMNGSDLPPGHLVQVDSDTKRGRFADLLSEEYRTTSFLLWYIWLASAFSVYGLTFVSPLIIKQGQLVTNDVQRNISWTSTDSMTEIVPCSSYTQQNFIDLLWTSAADFPGLLVFTFLSEACGRKLLLSGSCIISSFLLMLLLLRTYKFTILLVLFVARGILMSLFQLIFIVTSELYPTTFRALAVGVGSFLCKIGSLVVPYVSQVLVIEKPVLAMSLMSGTLFLAGVAAAFIPFETRGVNLKEIKSQQQQK